MQRAMIILTAVLLLVISTNADVPTRMNYQGRLTDASGNPVADTYHDVNFRLYNVRTGGVAEWLETHSVRTYDGLFTVTLGQVTPLLPELFDDTALYLGVQVGSLSAPELSPRQKLLASPYAMQSAISEQSSTVQGTFDGKIRTILRPESAIISRMLLQDSAGHEKISLTQHPLKTSLNLYRPNSQTVAAILETSAGNAYLAMYKASGGEAKIYLDADLVGNYSAMLPDSAISAAEMQNEPGLAANDDPTAQTITSSAAMEDVVTVTLTAPTAGYIYVVAKGNAYLSGTTGKNYIYTQIDETAGGLVAEPYWVAVGQMAYANSLGVFLPFTLTRVYQVAAGAHTYRMEASIPSNQGAGAVAEIRHSMIQAFFFPTSYGSVNTLVAAAEAGQFEQKTPEIVDGETRYRVDLRELEVKAARLEAETEKAKRELLEARLREAEK